MKYLISVLVLVCAFGVGSVHAQMDCEAKLQTAEQRLLKTLDALAHAEMLVAFKDKELAARADLEKLYKQAIEVKDLIIKFQDELIRKLQKPNSGFMGRLKSILRTAERVILLAAGVYVGGRL